MQVSVRNVPAKPLVRKHHVAVCLGGARRSCLVVGGVASSPISANHFVIFSPHDQFATVYTNSSPGPRKRSGHVGAMVKLSSRVLSNCAADHRVEGFLMIGGWGGREQGSLIADYWFLDTLTFKWSVPSFTGDLPDAVNLGLLLNWSDSELVLYRGGDGTHHHSDLWFLNLVNGVWRKVKRKRVDFTGTPTPWPSERTAPCGCVVPGPVLIMGGGWNATGILSDWWTFDGDEWAELRISGPVGRRTSAKLVYLDWAKVLCLVGGKSTADKDSPPLLMSSTATQFPAAAPGGITKPLCRTALTLTFSEPRVVDGGCFGGLVGHDACLVDNKLVITGGTDLTHKEPLAGAFIVELLTSSEFSRDDDELNALFSRPTGSFDSSHLIRYAGSDKLADVYFRAGAYALPAHQIALSSRSEFFAQYFSRKDTANKTLALTAPNYVDPCVFEIFLAMFYSLHLPTCLMIPRHRVIWEQPTGELYVRSGKQNLAILLAHCATVNYSEVVLGKQPRELPFPITTLSDCVTMLLSLTQLADQYVCDKIKNCLELYLACLAHKRGIQERLHQASRSLMMSKLGSYLERVCHITAPALHQMSMLLPHRTNNIVDIGDIPGSPGESSDQTGTTRDDGSHIDPNAVPDAILDQPPPTTRTRFPSIDDNRLRSDFSPLMLPVLKERNYGSARDLGRIPDPQPELLDNHETGDPGQNKLLRIFGAR